MQDLESTSTRISWFYAITTLLSSLVVLWIGQAVTKRIRAQIGGEPETAVAVAHAVANGKLDNEIVLAEGDESSLLASMKQMQGQLLERITAERVVAAENLSIRIALDNVSTGVMIANSERKVVYANNSVKRILKGAEAAIRQQLPNFDADNMVGVNIDTFHKNPKHQADLLATFTSTYVANLEINGRYMRVSASPVINDRGERMGAVAEWLDRTSEVLVEKEVANIVEGASRGDSMTAASSWLARKASS
jgi:methyl-accepting chemotaxis protein